MYTYSICEVVPKCHRNMSVCLCGLYDLIGLHPINLWDRRRAAVRLGVRIFPGMEQHRRQGTECGRNIHAGLDHIIMWLLLLFKSASIPKSVSGTEYFTVNWAFIREKMTQIGMCVSFSIYTSPLMKEVFGGAEGRELMEEHTSDNLLCKHESLQQDPCTRITLRPSKSRD